MNQRHTHSTHQPTDHPPFTPQRQEEINQRDLYDRPPLVLKGWAKGPVAILGDAAHPMMPNLGQGGCQAVEDGYRLAQVLFFFTWAGWVDGVGRERENPSSLPDPRTAPHTNKPSHQPTPTQNKTPGAEQDPGPRGRGVGAAHVRE